MKLHTVAVKKLLFSGRGFVTQLSEKVQCLTQTNGQQDGKAGKEKAAKNILGFPGK